MGNCNAVHGRWNMKMGTARRRVKKKRLEALNSYQAAHEGITTVGLEEVCNFSKPVLYLCLVTWNMNGKASYEDLAELVSKEDRGRIDLFVVGLQEVPRNVARLLQKALEETHSLVGASTMQSLQLFVFGPNNSELFIKEIKVDKHAIGGLGGLIGRKKGAVAISINFKEIRMMFVSCHLSAHEHNMEERNSQYRSISHSLFSKNRNPYSRTSQIIVWLGDLNYRLQGIGNIPARNLIQRNLHRLLTSKDQLLQEAERGQIFNGYCEGTLTFKPTYKYNVGSSNYDASNKVRIPSWTDRILFKIEKIDEIDASLHRYESIDYIYSSDHKPVRAHLSLKVKKLHRRSLPLSIVM